ncbi:hypothetical protein PAPYR_728 [Paratrimastix pyriformis]|uniref:Uncharacterized protein n=1 Tax=Paratrimastix pyriformis TaxID=342808 RepID=A0ABQ8UUB8_9EUKA|nr:hypothetical protein PAPYR_728 [Paratrimastix pyriformis]
MLLRAFYAFVLILVVSHVSGQLYNECDELCDLEASVCSDQSTEAFQTCTKQCPSNKAQCLHRCARDRNISRRQCAQDDLAVCVSSCDGVFLTPCQQMCKGGRTLCMAACQDPYQDCAGPCETLIGREKLACQEICLESRISCLANCSTDARACDDACSRADGLTLCDDTCLSNSLGALRSYCATNLQQCITDCAAQPEDSPAAMACLTQCLGRSIQCRGDQFQRLDACRDSCATDSGVVYDTGGVLAANCEAEWDLCSSECSRKARSPCLFTSPTLQAQRCELISSGTDLPSGVTAGERLDLLTGCDTDYRQCLTQCSRVYDICIDVSSAVSQADPAPAQPAAAAPTAPTSPATTTDMPLQAAAATAQAPTSIAAPSTSKTKPQMVQQLAAAARLAAHYPVSATPSSASSSTSTSTLRPLAAQPTTATATPTPTDVMTPNLLTTGNNKARQLSQAFSSPQTQSVRAQPQMAQPQTAQPQTAQPQTAQPQTAQIQASQTVGQQPLLSLPLPSDPSGPRAPSAWAAFAWQMPLEWFRSEINATTLDPLATVAQSPEDVELLLAVEQCGVDCSALRASCLARASAESLLCVSDCGWPPETASSTAPSTAVASSLAQSRPAAAPAAATNAPTSAASPVPARSTSGTYGPFSTFRKQEAAVKPLSAKVPAGGDPADSARNSRTLPKSGWARPTFHTTQVTSIPAAYTPVPLTTATAATGVIGASGAPPLNTPLLAPLAAPTPSTASSPTPATAAPPTARPNVTSEEALGVLRARRCATRCINRARNARALCHVESDMCEDDCLSVHPDVPCQSECVEELHSCRGFCTTRLSNVCLGECIELLLEATIMPNATRTPTDQVGAGAPPTDEVHKQQASTKVQQPGATGDSESDIVWPRVLESCSEECLQGWSGCMGQCDEESDSCVKECNAVKLAD